MAATCRLFHDWEKWDKPKEYPGRKYMLDGAMHETVFFIQRRECKRCGKEQRHTVKGV